MTEIYTAGVNKGQPDEIITKSLEQGTNIYLTENGFVETTDDYGVTVRGIATPLWRDFFQTNKAQRSKGSHTKSVHYTTNFLGYRLRCCLGNSEKGWGIVIRRLPIKIPSLRDDLGLDWNLIEPLTQGSGLTLFAGRMNSGKSTTMAGTIGQLDPRYHSISTVEDPIELVYPNPSIIQREVGTHVDSFAEAIRDCVRQNRTTIVISEIRDSDTANAAILAASTGSSVYGTIHSDNAFDVYTRMLALVDPRYERLLARSIRGIWWQQVFRFGTRERKPVPIYESLLIDNEARNVLEGGPSKLPKLASAMERQGRMDMAQVAMMAVSKGLASREELSEFLQRRNRLNID